AWASASSRRAALAAAGAVAISGLSARAQDGGPVGGLYTLNKPAVSGKSTFYRFDIEGNVKDIVTAELATRIIRMPENPGMCIGAEDGDLISITYAAAYEMKGVWDPTFTDEDRGFSLLGNPKKGEPRWKVYDSSRKRMAGAPFNLPLGDRTAVTGVNLGLQGMCEGEARVLYIPPSLAYGEKGNQVYGVPENALIRYE
ncbi:unnamed protein product, partial [Polarella glacialis]